MSKSYDRLRVLSFRLRQSEVESIPYWQVRFPVSWVEAIRSVLRGSPDDDRSIPIRSLNSTLRALLPGIVAIQPRAATDRATGWILAREPIPSSAILDITRAWMTVKFDEHPEFRKAYGKLRESDLGGEHVSIPLRVGVGRNGTAVAGQLHSLVPAELAAQLAASGRWDSDSDQPRSLFRIVGDDYSGSECMTWPPYAHGRRDGDWHFSTVLRFTLQTIPFDPAPVVNLEVNLRRWVRHETNGFLPLPKGRTSLYMRPRIHWIGDKSEPECFQVAMVGKTAREHGYRLEWKEDVGKILDILQWPRAPNLDRLQTDATSHFDDPLAMAIGFDNGSNAHHQVRPGWMPADRAPMREAVEHRLAAWLEPVELLPRVDPGSHRAARIALPDCGPRPAESDARKLWEAEREKKRLQAEFRQDLCVALPSERRLELLYQNTATRLALRDALTDLTGIPAAEAADEYRWQLGTCELVLPYRRLGAIGDALAESPGFSAPTPKYLAEMARRARQVQEFANLVPAEGTIVELQGKSSFGTNGVGGDPKRAIRKGLALAGRVSQFITPGTAVGDDAEGDEPEEGNLSHRAKNSWRDLFRQFGASGHQIRAALTSNTVPSDVQVVGIWFLNLQKKPDRPQIRLPVLVRIVADGDPIMVRLGTPELPDWLSYPEALRRIASLEQVEFHGWGADSIAHFVRDCLMKDLVGGGPVLLIAEAQNFRESWKWINNGQVSLDLLQLPPDGTRPITNWPGLRFVRVRLAANGEAPEAFGEEKTGLGFPKGLWKWSDRVYLSTASKPDTMKALSANQSKLRSYKTGKSEVHRRAAPDKSAWNPACLEITGAALQPGDDPIAWASSVHQLRFAAWHFDNPLALPLPLHLAKKFEDYIVPTRPNERNN